MIISLFAEKVNLLRESPRSSSESARSDPRKRAFFCGGTPVLLRSARREGEQDGSDFAVFMLNLREPVLLKPELTAFRVKKTGMGQIMTVNEKSMLYEQ